jgi:DNA repair protein RecN (Recombination protein N)
MQEHVESLLYELQTIVGKLEEAEILNDDSDYSASASSGCGGVTVSLRPLQELSVSLGAVLGAAKAQDGLDLSAAWDVLCDAETLLEGLSAAIADSAGANEPGGSGVDMGMMMLQEMDQEIDGGGDDGGSGLGGSGPDRRLEQVQRQLNGLSDDTSRMQADFFEMGFGGSQLNDVLERVQVAVQEAEASLGAAAQALDGLRRAVPELGPTLERMDSVRDEWGGLARKHSCQEDALGVLLTGWRGDLVSMRNIVDALPAAELEEGALRGEYAELARSLSEERATAAAQLQRAVSCLLPQIEMADKHFEVEVRSAFGVGTGMGTTLPQSAVRPGVLGVGADGWDEVHLVVSSGGHGEASVGSGSETQRLVASTGDLSSGEAARLALALEASSYGGDAHQEEEQPLVVYDEIDAHVGGEAAAAVSRLLKRIGRYRQVVAITHSPVVAAAADRHFVVSRDVEATASARRPRSTISEVEGRARQTEVARMATGRLDTDAGQQLARELLRLDFGGQ